MSKKISSKTVKNTIQTNTADKKSLSGLITDFLEQLKSPVSSASLELFRILSGVIFSIEGYRIFKYIKPFYFNTEFQFRMPLTEWIPFFSEGICNLLSLGLIISGVLIATGILFRLASFYFALIYGYFLFLDASFYNNHYYLILLIAILFIFTDIGKSFTLKKVFQRDLRVSVVPYRQLWIFRFQFFWVYLCAGLIKLNTEWLSGDVIRATLIMSSDYSKIKGYLDTELLIIFLTYGGLIFDLTVGFLLLFKKTRLLAVLAISFFHIVNIFNLKIGVFPYFMLGASILFFDPGLSVLKLFKSDFSTVTHISKSKSRISVTITIIYALLQITIPFRHYLIKDHVDWTGEGANFAWRMKSQVKYATRMDLFIIDKESNTEIKPDLYMHPMQVRTLYRQPYFIVQLKDYLLKKVNKNPDEVEVYARINIVLNMHPPTYIIDTTANISDIKLERVGHNTFLETFYTYK